MVFLGTEIFVHLLLDAFNNYGVGWFEPFAHQRISFHTIFVADPFFSLPAGLACLALLFLPSDHYRRLTWAKSAISFTVIYLAYALVNKAIVNNDIREHAKKEGISYRRSFTTPTPFNSWLWFVVMEQEQGFQVGYRSVFDGDDDSLQLTYFPRNEQLLRDIRDHQEVTNLKKFSQGYYTLVKKQDTIVFNDLRFGQEIGWYDPTQPFAFHYYLSHPEDNELVVQRGRFAQWNAATARSFWRRLRGLPSH
jgi:inner membrane protein